jgi:hypothetical protein
MASRSPAPSAVEYDLDALLADFLSDDEATRAKAVRQVCPCRMSWDTFQRCMDLVRNLQKDPSRRVRAAALHVFEDAFEMDSSGLPTSRQEVTNEMVARRRQMRWETDEEDELPESVEKDLWKRERDQERERKQNRTVASGHGRDTLARPRRRG